MFVYTCLFLPFFSFFSSSYIHIFYIHPCQGVVFYSTLSLPTLLGSLQELADSKHVSSRGRRDRNENLKIKDFVLKCSDFKSLGFVVSNDQRAWLHTTRSAIARSCCTHCRFVIGHAGCVLTPPEEEQKRGRGQPFRPAVTLGGLLYIQSDSRHGPQSDSKLKIRSTRHFKNTSILRFLKFFLF